MSNPWKISGAYGKQEDGGLWTLFGPVLFVCIITIPLLRWIDKQEDEARRERHASEVPTWNRASQGIDRGWLDETNPSRRR